MQFDLKKTVHKNVSKYREEDMKTAYEFAKRLYTEFKEFLKAVVIFGSVARSFQKEKYNDIDIMVIVDDVSMRLTPEIVEAYRIIVEKIIVDTSPRLHVTTLKLSAFWDYVRNSDPVAINILRDGIAVVDTGFFDPLQALLFMGRIRPTQESVWTYYGRAPRTLVNSRWHLMQATLDLYWAVIDAAHAALMKLGAVPPSPEHIADMMQDKLVRPGLMNKKHAHVPAKFYALSKAILHREKKEVHGKEYEELYKEAYDFVEHMRLFIEKH
ncbi:nucleotidyltransferase domain-containing protein [Candidatus Woesearchaeota archaeon]|nr:nucleotidyltransferase domain-containing protein [Candidatus Woesearchaeota archaeon]